MSFNQQSFDPSWFLPSASSSGPTEPMQAFSGVDRNEYAHQQRYVNPPPDVLRAATYQTVPQMMASYENEPIAYDGGDAGSSSQYMYRARIGPQSMRREWSHGSLAASSSSGYTSSQGMAVSPSFCGNDESLAMSDCGSPFGEFQGEEQQMLGEPSYQPGVGSQAIPRTMGQEIPDIDPQLLAWESGLYQFQAPEEDEPLASMALAGDPARQTWAHLSYRDGPGVSNQGEALSYGGFIETGQLQYQQPRTLSAHQSPVIQRSIHASDELAGGSSHVLESQPRINYSLLHAHVVPTSIRKQKKGRGGRQPGSHLPADDAANARSVRGVGSCWRCSFQKTKCSTHMTCSTCSAIVNFRTWPLGCERRSIKDMLRNSLVPDCFESRLTKSAVLEFVKDTVQCPTGKKFPLTLNAGFGRDFTLWGWEFKPKNDETVRFHSISVNEETGLQSVRSPPSRAFTVAFDKANLYATFTRLNAWAMETLQSPQAIQQWLRSLFPHNQPSWVASAIDSLWQFSYQSGIFQKEAPPGRGREPNVILLKAWKMAMLVVALTNLIYIPSDAGASITQHLQWGPTHNASDRISSRLTNKIIKFVLLAHYGRLVDEVLEGLDYLLRNQGQWKHAFGVTLLCVLVSGRMQEAQTDNMLVARRHGEDIRATTRAAVQELEQGITTVTNLFHLKYRTVRGASSAQNPFRPGSTLVKEDPHLQALIQQIEGARRQWSPIRCPPWTLDDMTEEKFAALNLSRLLDGFLTPFFHKPPGPKRR